MARRAFTLSAASSQTSRAGPRLPRRGLKGVSGMKETLSGYLAMAAIVVVIGVLVYSCVTSTSVCDEVEAWERAACEEYEDRGTRRDQRF